MPKASASNTLAFLSGCVQHKDSTWVIAQSEVPKSDAVDWWLVRWASTPSQWSRFELGFTATRLCFSLLPEPTLFVTGPAGKVLVVTAAEAVEETIDSSAEGPQGRGPIRDVRSIGSGVYAYGMSRQVYRRIGPGQWSRFDSEVVSPLGTKSVCGFNSIHGSSEDTIYAVGFNGEIWRCINSVWQQMQSPTANTLRKVQVLKNDLVYAIGQMGVLLEGDGESWEQIGQTKDELWGMEWFNDRLYLSSSNFIYCLDRDRQLVPIKLKGGTSCGYLHANDGVMWSFGAAHLLWTENGVDWNDVTPRSGIEFVGGEGAHL